MNIDRLIEQAQKLGFYLNLQGDRLSIMGGPDTPEADRLLKEFKAAETDVVAFLLDRRQAQAAAKAVGAK